jgi:hypothetical protein
MFPPRSASRLVPLVVAVALLAACASPALAAKKVELKGTLAVSPGRPATKAQQKEAKAKYTGSYFRMILPGGVDKYFANADSRAADKTYTLFRTGRERGLKLDAFQEPPTPAFAPNGFALTRRIVQPETFAGIDFSISTAATDAQTGQKATVPRLFATGRRLTGDFRAWTAEWNSIYFNQGAPKPNGSFPGFTKPVNGTYDPRSGRYELSWYSLIVGGPFNGFTGLWHLQGKLVS